MNLSRLDWLIIIVFLGFLFGIAAYARRYTRSVSDFLSANRCAGRYLLTMSDGWVSLGAIGVIANFEKFYQAGFAACWWGFMMAPPIGMIAALSGWVVYRYRETRAMTMAQFFEMRYSRRFRIFAGIIGWLSGILNYGVFPGITALFLIYFCGLPPTFLLAGFTVSTLAFVIATVLGVALIFTLFGGMITVMITDFLQAQFFNLVFLLILAWLMLRFSWPDIVHTLESAPPGQSLLNPFDQAGIKDFNVWFFGIIAFKVFYNRLGWQSTQGYNSAAKTPHEAKMAGVLGEWRNAVIYLLFLFMPVCAYVLLHDPSHAVAAASIQSSLARIHDPQIVKEMLTPVSMIAIFPAGLVGLFAAAMIAAAISSDNTQLHSWGSIFIQDVILPFRAAPLTPRQHFLLLRLSIVGVAVFAFFWSLFFPLRDYVLMYFLLTGTVYLGGSGSVIIGGLYWKRATTAGAWTAMIIGLVVAVSGIVLQSIWPAVPFLHRLTPKFPLNGAWLALLAYLTSITGFIAVSLLTCRQPFNLDQMLHRGPYALPDSTHAGDGTPVKKWQRLFGFNHEFTRGDRAIYLVKIAWTLFWLLCFIAGTIGSLTIGFSNHAWGQWWFFTVAIGAIACAVTVVWFLIGGVRDLFDLVRSLDRAQHDVSDDGSVSEFPHPPAGSSTP